MSINFVAHISAYTFGTSPITSVAYTPFAGNALLRFIATNASSTVSATGTQGSYALISPPGLNNDTDGDEFGSYSNLNAVASSQTYTLTTSATGAVNYDILVEYSATNNISNGAYSNRTGIASGANILGAAVTVPVGSTLVAICFSSLSATNVITAANGTSRWAVSDGTAGFTIADYAGAGSSVTPTFTSTEATGDYAIVQVMLNPPAANIGKRLGVAGPGISPDKRQQFLSKRLSSQQTIIAALSGQTILIGVTSGSLTALGYGALRSSGPGISPDYTKLFSARQFGFPQVAAPTPISGQTISLSIATGSLSGVGALSGEVNCISTFTGALNASGALSGETIALGIGTGLLVGAGSLSGDSMGLSVGIGSLSSTAPNLSGLSVSLSMGSGALTGVGALSGNVLVISTYTAELDGSVFLSGSTISISAATGLLIASSGTVTDLHQVYFIANVGTLMNR
jgi:hypothetical protein